MKKKINDIKVISCLTNPLYISVVALVLSVAALVCTFGSCGKNASVEEAIKAKPEMIVNAMQAYEQQAREQQLAEARKNIEANIDEINNNPNSPIIGNPDGKIILVEFFDYSCGYCHRLAPAIESIIKKNPDVKVIAKELTFLGQNSLYAAKAALAANEQGKYAQVYHAFMTNQGPLTEAKVLELAKKNGVDVDQMKKDMESEKVQNILSQTSQLSQKIGVSGVPTLILNGQMLQTIDESVIQQAINGLK